MKREFLQNLKVGDQSLSKEVIDAIMAENGRDVEAAKRPFADYQDIKDENQRLKAQQGDGLVDGKTAQEWKQAHDQAVADHKAQLADLDFQKKLDGAISTAKGRNGKAIRALLDMDARRVSKNQDEDIKAAVEALQKESGYLFDDEGVPPPYAAGTGTGGVGGTADGVTAAFSKLNPGLKI